MVVKEPMAELHPQFSSDDATPTDWTEALGRLEKAEVYWLSTVRPDGRPHVTPLLSAWLDGALYFCTGRDERKAKNLARNPHCVITTGCNALNEGLDLVIEGDAAQVSDEAKLQRLAERYASKYDWHFDVRDGAFFHPGGGEALVYEVTPAAAFGFGKGESFSQTRWRFERDGRGASGKAVVEDRKDEPLSRHEPVTDLPTGLAKPAQRALAGAGIQRLEQFTKLRQVDVMRLHGIGLKALDQIRDARAAKGMAFADDAQDDH